MLDETEIKQVKRAVREALYEHELARLQAEHQRIIKRFASTPWSREFDRQQSGWPHSDPHASEPVSQ